MSIAEKLQTIAQNEQRVYDAGCTAGQQAEYDAFWDSFQKNGNRRNYWGAFVSWPDELFKPKYPIIATENKSMFYLCNASHIPVLDFRNTVRVVDNTFDYFYGTTIEKIIIKEDGSQSVNGGFNGAKYLTTIAFEGVIGNSISFAECPLTKESIENIVSVLSAESTGKTVTFKKGAVNKAFETVENAADGTASEQWLALVATKPNWTITLV